MTTDRSVPPALDLVYPDAGLWRLYCGLTAGLALVLAGASLAAGLSVIRVALAGILLLLAALSGWCALEARPRPAQAAARWCAIFSRLQRRRTWNMALIAALLGLYGGLVWLVVGIDPVDAYTGAILERLLAGAAFVAGFSLLSLWFLLRLRYRQALWRFLPRERAFYFAAALLGLLLLAWWWATQTILPTESQRVGWNAMGAPITGLQLLLVWLVGLGLLWLRPRLPFRAVWQHWRGDVLLALLIWLAAVLIWQLTPLHPNWFVTAPAPPNQENYPSSDAWVYDTPSQTALLGLGYRLSGSSFIRRPLLAALITLFHVIGGQAYARVILVQLMWLALIPVLAFLLGRRLHSRLAGVMLAGLLIVRQVNAIALTNIITTSNVKLLMADMPSLLLVLLLALLVIMWMQHITTRPLLALVCGGALGLAMLIRIETLVMAFPILAVSGLYLWPRRRLLLGSWLLAALGVLLALAPWVGRNYFVTGELILDHPFFNMSLLIQRFDPAYKQPLTPADPGMQDVNPAEPTPQSQRLAPGPQRIAWLVETPPPPTPTPEPEPLAATQHMLAPATQRALDNLSNNIVQLAPVLAAHMLNSQIQAILVLPTASRTPDSLARMTAHRSPERLWQECCAAESYLRWLPYWRKWNGVLPLRVWPPLALNLVLLAAGLALMWRRWRWIGLLPGLMGLSYLIFNGLLRNSGGRYLLPIDWISLFYFTVGLSDVTRRGLAYLAGQDDQPRPAPKIDRANAVLPRQAAWRYGLVALVILALGALPAGLELAFPLRYTPARSQAMLEALLNSPELAPAQRQALQGFIDQGGQVLVGRALYPRFLQVGVGDPGNKATQFPPQPYPRLVFHLASENNLNMALPLTARPGPFPNAVDVLVLTCPNNDPLAVARYADDGSLQRVYLRAPFPVEAICPLPPIQ